MDDLLIRNCTVVTLDHAYTILPSHDVAVSGGRIVAVRPTGGSDPATKVIDGNGLYLLPGLINTHTHVGQAYFKGTTAAMELFKWLEYGWFYIQRMSEEDIYWLALLNVLEMIKAGVTTFCDMYFWEHNIARAVEQAGIRACLGEGIMEPGPGMEARLPIDDQIGYALDVHQRWNGAANDRIRIFMAPHSLYLCSAPTIEKVVDASSRLGAPIAIHLSETQHEMTQAQAHWGMTPPERMSALGMLSQKIVAAHCVHLTPSDIELLDRSTFGVAHNPTSNLKLQSGRAPIETLVGRRMAVGLGSDGCGSNDVIDLLKESYLAAIMHPWTEEQRAAHTTLALAYTARGDDVVTTIVNGNVLMEHRVVTTLDEAEILAQARERAARIFAPAYPGRS